MSSSGDRSSALDERPTAPAMRAILVGAGRMGLTHLALFNLVTDFAIRWVVVEPSAAVRWGLRRTLPRQLIESCERSIPRDRGAFDLAVVTSPTPAHALAYRRLAGTARKIFVEKPLAVPGPTASTLCGYVLLHHPLHARMRGEVGGDAIRKLRVALRANTVLGPNAGWRGRASRGGGVVSEFGSHALSLLIDLLGPVATIAVTAGEIVHSVDVLDRATLAGRSTRGVDFEVVLDWTDAATRKPTYEVRCERADGSVVEHDFNEYRSGGLAVSVADSESRIGRYLRGIEFTNQARFFLDNDAFPEPISVAVEVDRVLGILRDRPR